ALRIRPFDAGPAARVPPAKRITRPRRLGAGAGAESPGNRPRHGPGVRPVPFLSPEVMSSDAPGPVKAFRAARAGGRGGGSTPAYAAAPRRGGRAAPSPAAPGRG